MSRTHYKPLISPQRYDVVICSLLQSLYCSQWLIINWDVMLRPKIRRDPGRSVAALLWNLTLDKQEEEKLTDWLGKVGGNWSVMVRSGGCERGIVQIGMRNRRSTGRIQWRKRERTRGRNLTKMAIKRWLTQRRKPRKMTEKWKQGKCLSLFSLLLFIGVTTIVLTYCEWNKMSWEKTKDNCMENEWRASSFQVASLSHGKRQGQKAGLSSRNANNRTDKAIKGNTCKDTTL